MITRIARWISEKLVVLNLYESNVTDNETVHRERLSTRVYLSLVVLTLIALILYAGLTVRTNTITVTFPSQMEFEHLLAHYPTTLQCLCSQAAISYGTFVEIQVTFHQVCSSFFVSPQWIQSVYATNVSFIWPMDVRTTSSAFWQLVAAFCQNSQTIVTNTLLEYNDSTIFSPQVISPSEMAIRVQTSLNFALTTAQATLSRNLLTIRSITSSNQLISGLATNGHLIAPGSGGQVNPIINSYDGCSCLRMDGCPKLSGLFEFGMWDTMGMYSSMGANKSVPGILFDCYPLDATLGSTLECYYESACLALIHGTLNATPLSSLSPTQFQINTTIRTLLDELFIEETTNKVSFALYYLQCNPSLCTYIYLRRFDLLFMLTTIIGVFGGLVVILKMFAPLIVKATLTLHQCCRPIVEQPVHPDINYGKLAAVTLQRLKNHLLHKTNVLK